LGCWFFFDSARKFVNDKFPNLSKGTSDHLAKIAAKGTIDGYGWLNSIYDVAKEGIFNMPNESPLESVLKSDLGKIMTYLSWKSATNSYEKLYNELISKKYKNK
jgi:hypothetical protein